MRGRRVSVLGAMDRHGIRYYIIRIGKNGPCQLDLSFWPKRISMIETDNVEC